MYVNEWEQLDGSLWSHKPFLPTHTLAHTDTDTEGNCRRSSGGHSVSVYGTMLRKIDFLCTLVFRAFKLFTHLRYGTRQYWNLSFSISHRVSIVSLICQLEFLFRTPLCILENCVDNIICLTLCYTSTLENMCMVFFRLCKYLVHLCFSIWCSCSGFIITFFCFYQVVSAVNCARRGWVNVDVDTIACEACGARIFFSTPSSWSHHQGMYSCLFSFLL